MSKWSNDICIFIVKDELYWRVGATFRNIFEISLYEG